MGGDDSGMLSAADRKGLIAKLDRWALASAGGITVRIAGAERSLYLDEAAATHVELRLSRLLPQILARARKGFVSCITVILEEAAHGEISLDQAWDYAFENPGEAAQTAIALVLYQSRERDNASKRNNASKKGAPKKEKIRELATQILDKARNRPSGKELRSKIIAQGFNPKSVSRAVSDDWLKNIKGHSAA